MRRARRGSAREAYIQSGGVVQMVATGKVDFGIAGADEVIAARARGAEPRLSGEREAAFNTSR